MLTVWKYHIAVNDLVIIAMPKGAQILTVQLQNETPVIWALLNPAETETELRTFICAGTGHNINVPAEKLVYINTYQLLNGGFVGHLFEKTE
jgi:hypothetical protein